MKVLISYLMSEGIIKTVQKVFEKIIHKVSVTVFLVCRDAQNTVDIPSNISFEELRAENLSIFETLKFFQHISGEEILADPQQTAILVKCAGEYAGYAGVQFETHRQIHGLCCFILREKEAWIGPVYIKRKFRNRGLNRYTLQFIMDGMKKMGFCAFFTAINSANHSSMKSFMNCGFSDIGHVISKNGQTKTAAGECDFLSRYQP